MYNQGYIQVLDIHSITYQVTSERIVILNKVDHINSEGGESGDTTEIVVYCTCNIKYKLSWCPMNKHHQLPPILKYWRSSSILLQESSAQVTDVVNSAYGTHSTPHLNCSQVADNLAIKHLSLERLSCTLPSRAPTVRRCIWLLMCHALLCLTYISTGPHICRRYLWVANWEFAPGFGSNVLGGPYESQKRVRSLLGRVYLCVSFHESLFLRDLKILCRCHRLMWGDLFLFGPSRWVCLWLESV